MSPLGLARGRNAAHRRARVVCR